jgi:hypothetical protein
MKKALAEYTLYELEDFVKVKWLALHPPPPEVEEEHFEMGDNPPLPPPPRRTLGDYGQWNDGQLANLGFQPENPVNFDIKNSIINALK